MQIGQTIWAIDPKETSVTFGNSYEIYERRKGVAFSVINEKGVRIWFEENEFDKYFSLTPPKEKEGVNNRIGWIAVSERLPEFGETVLVYCKIYGKFLATYEFIGDFQGEKYGNWRDLNGNLGILPPVYWLQIPETPNSATI